MQPLNWMPKAAGVWSAQLGSIEEYAPLSISGARPKLEAIAAMSDAPLPFHLHDVFYEQLSGKVVIRLPLTNQEKIYGLGLQFKRINHRGRTRFLRVNSDPKQDTGETHAPVPFYVSSLGYGVLVNTSRIVTIYCGSSVRRSQSAMHTQVRDRNTDSEWLATPISDCAEIVFHGTQAELLVFAGPTPFEVVRRYNLYCGGGVLPPRWGLGLWQRLPTLYASDRVQDVAKEYRKRGIPCDVIGLEPGWHSASYPATNDWSPARFPRPQAFIDTLQKWGFKVNLWEHPYVSPHSSLFSQLEPYAGTYTVWGGIVPDYTCSEAQQIYQVHHEHMHVMMGVSGYKIDECDGSELTNNAWMFPEHTRFPSGRDGEQLRQIYGMLMQRMTAELFRKNDRRTYGLVRASNAGATSLPYALYSDLSDHKEYVRALINSSYSGLLWAPELRSAHSPELFVRRLQLACFSPLMMMDAWHTEVFPWSFPTVTPIVTKYIQLRMRLLPYFYSAFARYRFEGIPPFRAMNLDYGDDEHVRNHDYDDQYLAGDHLLIAPMFEGNYSRTVYLPPGDWYDFDTNRRYHGAKCIEVVPGLDSIPVFVRAGAILPLMPPLTHAPKPGDNVPIEVRCYGKRHHSFMLYDDDGETYRFEQGEYQWIKLSVEYKEKNVPEGFVHRQEHPPSVGCYHAFTWKFIQ